MKNIPWIIIGIIVLGALVAFLIFKKKKETPTDYRALFIVGVSWLPLGIATENHAFTAIGIVFMVLGLKNKDKWKEQGKWSELPAGSKWTKVILIGLALFVLIGGLAYYYSSK